MPEVREFIERHFRHFNAATVVGAAAAWEKHLEAGGKMLVALGGAMSTAEIGLVLAELIRQDKVHALSVTGANLEEDLFNLVAHRSYVRVPKYRELGPQAEHALLERGLNRVTDTCIPEHAAMRKLEHLLMKHWTRADARGERYAPHEYVYQLVGSGELEDHYDMDPAGSWVLAAAGKHLPIVVPGWEDSTLGNLFAAAVLRDKLSGHSLVKSGTEQMAALVRWYEETCASFPMGFFQIGGGISGDFPLCVVPLLEQDLRRTARKWSYFCQISEAKTSYGSYSGAPPNEKITWGKLDVTSSAFVIESDATIVFPLIGAYLLKL